MSEEKEQDKEKISASLQGSSINATNVTIIQGSTVDQSSTNEQRTKVSPGKQEPADSVKTKNIPLWAAVITALGTILSGTIIGVPHWLESNKTATTNTPKIQKASEKIPSQTNPPTSAKTKSNPLLQDEHQTSQLSSGFKAGNYSRTIKDLTYKVSGPSYLGNREAWSITNSDGSFSAQWYTGTKDGHPFLASYRYSYKLADGLSYGRVGTINPKAHSNRFKNWEKERVISVQQTGDNLTLTQYTNGRPGETLSLRLQK